MNFFRYSIFIIGVLVFPSVLFAQQKIDYDKPYDQIKSQISSFQDRHSLMPMPVEENIVENNNQTNNQTNDANQENIENSSPVQHNLKDDEKSYEQNSDEKVEPVIVSGNKDLEPVVLKRPEPKVQKPEGYDELMEMARQQGGVIKPSSYVEDENGNLIIPQNSQVDNNVNNIKSNLIVENKNNVVNKPLFEKKSNNQTDSNENNVISEEKPFQAMAHIASYQSEESARHGIVEIEKKYPQTNIFEPFVNYEYVKGKGNFFRLYFVGDERELQYLCRDMKKNGDWCNILK